MKITARWRQHRANARTDRAFARAMNRANTPASREELQTMQNRLR